MSTALTEYMQCADLFKLCEILHAWYSSGNSQVAVYVCHWPPQKSELLDTNEITSEFILKVQAHTAADPTREPAHAEARMLTWIRDNIIVSGYSPAFIEIVHTRDCTTQPFADIRAVLQRADTALTRKEYTVHRNFARFAYGIGDSAGRGTGTRNITMTAMERCDLSLDELFERKLRNDSKSAGVFTALMFMVIHAFHILHLLLPQTHHRDLHVGNVLIKIVDAHARPKRVHKFVVGTHVWYVPDIGIWPKIIDFGGVISPELGIDSAQQLEVTRVWNYGNNDIERLLAHVADAAATAGNKKIGAVIDAINPRKHHRDGSIVGYDSPDFPTTLELLQSSAFSAYTRVPPVATVVAREFVYPHP